jgi:hypothetical protein
MADNRQVQTVSLGCGTLILIALIVMFFSRPGVGDLKDEVHGLRHDVTELKRSIDEQTGRIRALEEKIDRVKAKD